MWHTWHANVLVDRKHVKDQGLRCVPNCVPCRIRRWHTWHTLASGAPAFDPVDRCLGSIAFKLECVVEADCADNKRACSHECDAEEQSIHLYKRYAKAKENEASCKVQCDYEQFQDVDSQ